MNSNDAKTRYNRVILKVNIFSKSSKKQPFSNLFKLIWNLSIDKKVVLMAVINARMEERAGIVRTPVGKLNAFYRGKKIRKRSSRGRNDLKLSMPTLAAALKLAGAVPARPGGQAGPLPFSPFPLPLPRNCSPRRAVGQILRAPECRTV